MKIMLKISIIINLIVVVILVLSYFSGRVRTVVYHSILHGNVSKVTYKMSYENRQSIFNIMPEDTSAIYFIGNSIIAGIEWNELFNNIHIKNRGIGGDLTNGVLSRINEIAIARPQKVFLLIGINDLLQKIEHKNIIDNYKRILEIIQSKSPNTKIYLQSIMPVNSKGVKSDDIIKVNKELNRLCTDINCNYIDLFSLFKNEKNELKEEYSFDGVHINGKGYEIWEYKIRQYL